MYPVITRTFDYCCILISRIANGRMINVVLHYCHRNVQLHRIIQDINSSVR